MAKRKEIEVELTPYEERKELQRARRSAEIERQHERKVKRRDKRSQAY